MVGALSNFWLSYRGHRIPVRTGETVVGRSPYCTLVVKDALVSRQHCAIHLDTNGLRVLDLQSTNGTRVNQKTIQGSCLLRHGDTLQIGTDPIEVLELEGALSSSSKCDTHMKRVDTEAPPPLGDTDAITLTGTTTLDLIEALAETTVTKEVAARVSETVQRIVNELMDELLDPGRQQQSDPDRVAERLCDVSGKVAAWFQDGQLNEWRDQVQGRLAQAS